MLNKLEKLEKLIVSLSAVIGCALLLVNIADILLGVYVRSLNLNLKLVWTEELARFTLVWFVLIGASAAYHEGDHMAIDFIVNKFNFKLQALCKFIALIIQLIVLGVLIYYGWLNIQGSWAVKTMALKISRAWPLMAVPLGAGMLFIVLILHYINKQHD